MNKVYINIVTWNSLKFLPEALRSIYNQTYKDFSVLIIDNGSTDGTLEFVRTNYPTITILRNTRNLGFARAHNQGIDFAFKTWQANGANLDQRFVLVMNPDVILDKDFLTNILEATDQNEGVGSFGGKLLRAHESDESAELVSTCSVIDSAGLSVKKSREVLDRGSSLEDRGEYDFNEYIFGVSGALCLYRASALAETKIFIEYFDQSFFMYKEDVDLAWRLQNFGWSSFYVSNATAHHFRSLKAAQVKSFREFLRNRRNRSSRANFYSYRNHLAAIIKNEFWQNLLRHLPWIVGYELQKFFYCLIFEPRLLLVWPSLFLRLPRILKQRKMIMRGVKIKPHDFREWLI